MITAFAANEIGRLWRVGAEFAGGTTTRIGVKTGAAKSVYADEITFVSSSDDATMTLYEGLTYTGGVAMTQRQRSRNYPNEVAPLSEIFNGVTAVDDPTKAIAQQRTVANQRSAASVGGSLAPLILKPNTFYVLTVVTSGTPGTNNVTAFSASIYSEI